MDECEGKERFLVDFNNSSWVLATAGNRLVGIFSWAGFKSESSMEFTTTTVREDNRIHDVAGWGGEPHWPITVQIEIKKHTKEYM